jgi:excinuclease ABC subunit C
MDINKKLCNLPQKPGVYLFKNQDGKILYVGKAKKLRNRVRSYFSQRNGSLQKSNSLPKGTTANNPRLQSLITKLTDFDYIVTDSDVEALILEANLIKQYKPRYNVNLKDDKSYPYIRITAEDFPQVFPTRKVIRDGSNYFGPYTNVKQMRASLTVLKRLFTIRSCKYHLTDDTILRRKVKLCLDYYIKKCKGPCQALQSKEEYHKTIEKVKQFLKGKTLDILYDLRQEMQYFSDQLAFEEAAHIRNKIEILEKYRNSQKVVTKDLLDRDVFAVAREDNDACAVIFKIREGKVLGRVHYYLNGVLNREINEITEHFINQYYNNSDEIPDEIFIPLELENQSTIENWLQSRSGQKIKMIAPKIGEKKKLMTMCEKNAGYLLEELKLQKMQKKGYIPHALYSLQRDLHLEKPPRHIECFDISNLSGTDAVGAMVCFIDGKPKKSEYRRYQIKTKDTPDDYLMMKEVVRRRYLRILSEKKELPELIIVDGGKGQLSSTVSALKELKIINQPVIALAKRLDEIFFPGISASQMLPKTSSSLKLLQHIRDEAHRFAVSYHRIKRKKRSLTSRLDQIAGIGPKRRNELIKTFGSLQNMSQLNIEEIYQRGKIPKEIAQRIFHFLHAQ